MGGFIARQPNGLYCRFSTVVDCPTHWNLTEEDYAELCAERAREEAREILKHHVRPFGEVEDRFMPVNMTNKEFQEFLKEVGDRGGE